MSDVASVNPDQQPYDRLEEVKRFDETKAGVKGLLDSGLIATIPSIFHHPHESRPDLKTKTGHTQSSHQIPTIDFSLPRSTVAEEIRQAAATIGFFQVINHGIAKEAMSRTLDSIRAFSALPAEERAAHYCRELDSGFSYMSNLDLYMSKAASWRDTMQIRTGPVPPNPGSVPDVVQNLVSEWDPEVLKLGQLVMGILCEELGVNTDRLKELACLEARVVVAHYYPHCPQPDLTYGLTPHRDPDVITVLLQNEVGGLQVKCGEEWVDVKPVEGALVINIGDILQIMSNDEYKSVEHRVLANDQETPRLSIAVFLNTSNREDLLGPFSELITLEKPAHYRKFTLSDFMQRYFGKELEGKTLANFYRI